MYIREIGGKRKWLQVVAVRLDTNEGANELYWLAGKETDLERMSSMLGWLKIDNESVLTGEESIEKMPGVLWGDDKRRKW